MVGGGRNLGEGNIDTDDILEGKTEWMSPLIQFNQLWAFINVHSNEPNTHIDKIHKAFISMLTSSSKATTIQGSHLTFKYAFFQRFNRQIYSYGFSVCFKSNQGRKFIATREERVKPGFCGNDQGRSQIL